MGNIFESLPDGLPHVGARRDIEQPLIRLRILNHGFRFAVYSEDHRLLGLFELPHKLSGFAPEGSQRLYVPGDVEHVTFFFEDSTF